MRSESSPSAGWRETYREMAVNTPDAPESDGNTGETAW